MKPKKLITGVLLATVILLALAPAASATNEQSKIGSTFNAQQHEITLKEIVTDKELIKEEAMEAAEIQREKAIEIAKDSVAIPDDYFQYKVNFYTNGHGPDSVWEIEWRKNSRQSSHEISVTINANTGEIPGIQVSNQAFDREPAPFPPKYDVEDAVDIATNYINSIFPSMTKELFHHSSSRKQFVSLPVHEQSSVTIHFYQKINGIPFDRNSVSVTIDEHGNVKSFNYDWFENVNYEDPGELISEQDAVRIFSESLEMELRYLYDEYRANGNEDVRLAYVPKSEFAYQNYRNWFSSINAQTGERVQHYIAFNEQTDKWVLHYETTIKDELVVPDGPLLKTPKPLPNYSDKPLTLTEDEAIERIEALFNISEIVEYSSDYLQGDTDRNEFSIWSFIFQVNDQSDVPMYYFTELNANTGEILEFRTDLTLQIENEVNDLKVNVSREQALEAAIEFVKDASSSKADRLYATAPYGSYFNDNGEPRFYNVYFTRKENGILVENQGVEVMISAETGDVVKYHLIWDELDLPNAKDVITADEAKQLLIKNTNFSLKYETIIGNEEIYNTFIYNGDFSEEDREANVVYQPSPSLNQKYLDAKTGVWKNIKTGRPLYRSHEATDIDGHWAEDALKVMIMYDIFDIKDGKLNPDDKLTKAELIEVFVKAVSGRKYYISTDKLPFSDVAIDASYYPYIQHALQQDLIDGEKSEFKPDERRIWLWNMGVFRNVYSYCYFYRCYILDRPLISRRI